MFFIKSEVREMKPFLPLAFQQTTKHTMNKGYPGPPPPGVHPVGGPMPPPMAQGRGPPMSQYGRQPYGPQPGFNNGMPPPGKF